MERTGRVCGLILVFLSFGVFCFAQDEPLSATGRSGSSKSEKQARVILQAACDKINRIYKDDGFTLMVPSADNCNFTFHASSKGEPATWGSYDGIHRPNQGPSADILADSGKITGFTHMAVQLAMDNARNSQPTSRQWSPERIIDVASKFAGIFTEGRNLRLSKPVLDGWQVRWSELSSTGVPFMESGVTVYVSASYGPYSIGTNIGSCPYTPKTFKPISRDEAKKRANIEFTKSSGVALYGNAARNFQARTIGLLVVQVDGQGRLAWVVTYGNTKETASSWSGAFTIILDAEDGKLLRSMGPVIVD